MNLNLIYDRNESDVQYAKALRNKIVNREATDVEISEWIAGLKGCLNAADLNRIGQAVQSLSNFLHAEGYSTEAPAQVWETGEFPVSDKVSIFLLSITSLKNAIVLFADTPEVPSALWYFENINDVEKILFDLNVLLEEMKRFYIYSGESYCGG